MNTTKLKVAGVTLAFVALAAVVMWQQWRAKRLTVAADDMRGEIEQTAALREENQRLQEQLRVSSQRSEADSSELARLRGQAVRLRQMEQENAQLKAERAQSAKQPAALPIVPDEQTPEWRQAQVKMRFSKAIGLAIRSFANGNQGQMPTNVLAALSSMTERNLAELLADQLPAEVAPQDVRTDDFELVFQGNLKATGRQPGTTMIARTKEPIRLSNGRWARPCVLDDGGGGVLVADSLNELAAKERPLIQAPVSR